MIIKWIFKSFIKTVAIIAITTTIDKHRDYEIINDKLIKLIKMKQSTMTK